MSEPGESQRQFSEAFKEAAVRRLEAGEKIAAVAAAIRVQAEAFVSVAQRLAGDGVGRVQPQTRAEGAGLEGRRSLRGGRSVLPLGTPSRPLRRLRRSVTTHPL